MSLPRPGDFRCRYCGSRWTDPPGQAPCLANEMGDGHPQPGAYHVWNDARVFREEYAGLWRMQLRAGGGAAMLPPGALA